MFELVKEDDPQSNNNAINDNSKNNSPKNNNPTNNKTSSLHSNTHNAINPDTLNWSAIGNGSSNYESCSLEQVSSHRFELVETSHAKTFHLMFLGVGIFLFLGFLLSLTTPEINWMLLLCSIGFSSVIIIFRTQSAVLDTELGWFWIGSRKFTKQTDIRNVKRKGRTSRIVAIQVLEEYVTDSDGDYYCYELNFIMKNGKRRNFMRHGGVDGMRHDARKLASFLDVPCFDNLSK